jgi:hypothetical protein
MLLPISVPLAVFSAGTPSAHTTHGVEAGHRFTSSPWPVHKPGTLLKNQPTPSSTQSGGHLGIAHLGIAYFVHADHRRNLDGGASAEERELLSGGGVKYLIESGSITRVIGRP